jgi:hypothetical protein
MPWNPSIPSAERITACRIVRRGCSAVFGEWRRRLDADERQNGGVDAVAMPRGQPLDIGPPAKDRRQIIVVASFDNEPQPSAARRRARNSQGNVDTVLITTPRYSAHQDSNSPIHHVAKDPDMAMSAQERLVKDS